jgi:hypothetical protein
MVEKDSLFFPAVITLALFSVVAFFSGLIASGAVAPRALVDLIPMSVAVTCLIFLIWLLFLRPAAPAAE